MFLIAEVVQVGRQGVVDSNTKRNDILRSGGLENQGITLFGSLVDLVHIVARLAQWSVEQAHKLKLVATLVVLKDEVTAVIPIGAIGVRGLVVEVLLHTYDVEVVGRQNTLHIYRLVVVSPRLAIYRNREDVGHAIACERIVVVAHSLTTDVPHIDFEVDLGIVVL